MTLSMLPLNTLVNTLARLFFSLCAALLLLAPPCHGATAADPHGVLVMGNSRIYTDILAARTAAVSQCQLTAVERTAIEMIPFDILSEKFETIADLLSSRHNQFISDYKVLREINMEKEYRVLVQVTVSASKLKEALADAGIVLSAIKLPKILFLIAEQQADDLSPQFWWRKEKSFFQTEAAAREMKKIFAEKEFSIIDDEMIPPGMFEDLGLTAELTDDQAVALGKRVNADMVIAGTATAAEMSNRMGEDVRTFRAAVTARGLVVETGEQIALATHSATSVSRDIATGSSQALADAGVQAGIQLTTQILSKWQAIIEKAGEITLAIKGNDILPYLVLFRNELKKIEGIGSQQTQEMTPDEARLLIQFDGTTNDLADALLQKTFESFGINIYELSETELHIELFAK